MDYRELAGLFKREYGESDFPIVIFRAPGRVNLIGEHTDYNGGYVFPAAITMDTTVVARKRGDDVVKFHATDLDDRVTAGIEDMDQYKSLGWGNYQMGVFDQLKKHGYKICGCEMLFHGNIPFGAGLSSSASIEVATAFTQMGLNYPDVIPDDKLKIEIALICQKAENEYVGVNCGIMDQFASAMGRENHGVLLNSGTMDYELIRLDLKGYKVVISNTNKKRNLALSLYNERRRESEEALKSLKRLFCDAKHLCDINHRDYMVNEYLIRDKVIRRRARHVISENSRVLRSVDVLKGGDLEGFGRLMAESHQSLRDDYEVTGPELDTLVESALRQRGVIGSRMTGAGFGGCTVSLVKEDSIDDFIENVGGEYSEKIGYDASFYVTETADGAGKVSFP